MRDNRTSGRFLHFGAALLLCLFALAHPARGQQPQQTGAGRAPQEPGDVVRISTDLVETPVAVFDRQGRFVDNLGPEQFELRVDGKVVPVAFFERVGEHARGGAGVPRAASVPEDPGAARGRKVVFFVDDLHLSPDSVEHVRKSLLRFVEAEMGLNDQVAVATASGQVGFLQQFTDNKAVLRAAVGRIKYRPSAAQDAASPAMSEYVAFKIAEGDRDALTFHANEMLRSLQFTWALPKYGGKGAGYRAGSESDQAERMVAQRAQSIVARSAGNTLASLSALENFLRSSAQTPGRTHVLFISDGFFMQASESFRQKLQRVTDAAARSGGAVYTLDARALARRPAGSATKLDAAGRPDKFSEGEAEAYGAALAALAENTGGRPLTDAEDFGASVGRAVEETFNYYLLAWRPETEAQKVERFRQIQVSVPGQTGLTVRVTRGFLEAETDAPRKAAKTEGADSRTTSAAAPAPQPTAPARGQELPTRLAVEFLNTPDGRMMLTASTQVATNVLAYGEAGNEAAAVDLAGVIMDEHGNRAGSFGTRLNVEPLAAEPARGQSPVVIYNHRAPLVPGIYQVRVAARDGRTGRAGRAAAWVEIPDLAGGRMTLSSLFLGIQEVAAGAKAGGGAPLVQFSVDHRFTRDAPLRFFLFIYNAAAGAQLAVEARVTRDRQVQLTVPPQRVAPVAAAPDPRRIPFGGAFPLKSLPPGNYLLRVTVTDSRARSSASQDAKFVVE